MKTEITSIADMTVMIILNCIERTFIYMSPFTDPKNGVGRNKCLPRKVTVKQQTYDTVILPQTALQKCYKQGGHID